MRNSVPFVFAAAALVAVFLSGCAASGDKNPREPGISKHRVLSVRTTAYCHLEGSSKNAVGKRLSGGKIKSAASDWSKFPLDTKFRIIETSEIYVIDDYGSALVGKETIDLYKTSMKAMRSWGVRTVKIEILHWGSYERSLQILKERQRAGYVRRMVESLRKKVE